MSTDDIQLSPDESSFLNLVPKNGSRIGNVKIQSKLDWDEEQYWAVRDRLVDLGVIKRGVGRGGTVYRALETPTDHDLTVTVPADDPAEAAAIAAEAVKREEALYEPLVSTIRGAWARDRRSSLLAAEVIARQGRRATGGTWSRPDIVTVEVLNLLYVPTKILEVVTFEVKPSDAINVQCVYEALAHRRAATHAYVALHTPQAARGADLLDELVAAARSHGVGVVTFGDPSDYETWDEVARAERVDPDPQRLNGFIETQLSSTTKDKLARALR